MCEHWKDTRIEQFTFPAVLLLKVSLCQNILFCVYLLHNGITISLFVPQTAICILCNHSTHSYLCPILLVRAMILNSECLRFYENLHNIVYSRNRHAPTFKSYSTQHNTEYTHLVIFDFSVIRCHNGMESIRHLIWLIIRIWFHCSIWNSNTFVRGTQGNSFMHRVHTQ